jgi:hypothetical protein
MKALLSHAKEEEIWHKHWGNAAFTVETPDKKDDQGVKMKYIQKGTDPWVSKPKHGGAQIKGMIDINTAFTLCLTPDLDGKPRKPTTKLVRDVFNLMQIEEKKVRICLVTGLNGMSTRYFSSVMDMIKEHVAAFVTCPGEQVYWWLLHQGCLKEDVIKMIRHCFTLAQQQKVTQSKYLMEQGYTYVKDDGADDILHVANAEGIYDLSLRLSEKEKQLSIAGKSHNALAISFGEATEGVVEAHNFSVLVSGTTTHLCTEKKRDAESVVTKQTLAKSIISIGMTKVTNESKGKNEDESDDNKVESMNKVLGNP